MGSQSAATIEEIYQQALETNTDIKSHLSTLRKYAERCDSITEFGFRKGTSTIAFLAAQPVWVTSVDWDKAPFEVDFMKIREYTQNSGKTKFKFIASDTLDVIIPMTDMLFIDTFHTYEHLFLELMRHADSVNFCIAIHDTEEPSCAGLFHAIEDFLLDNPCWEIKERLRDRPGLTILTRVNDDPIHSYSQAFIKTLQNEVGAQKDIYYEKIGPHGSLNPAWQDYMGKMAIRFKDFSRWPLSNKRLGATEIAQKYNTHQTEN